MVISGDNDTMAAYVAALVKADLLILMSDIEGLYTDDPKKNPKARFVHTVGHIDEEIEAMGKGAGTELGTGGMATKIEAAKIATCAGADMVIADGHNIYTINDIMAGKKIGTLFLSEDKEYIGENEYAPAREEFRRKAKRRKKSIFAKRIFRNIVRHAREELQMSYMQVIGKRAKEVSKTVQFLGQIEKNEGLRSVARELRLQTPYILQANAIDVAKARDEGMKPSLIDRLLLTSQRINGMAEGLEQVAELDDPIGEIISMKVRPNGLQIGKRRVPLGVIGIIYESRPNVTADAFGLCFKTGNVAILRGGSDAFYSNQAIVKVIKDGLRKEHLPEDAVLMIEKTDRSIVQEMMKLKEFIDVLIPRGGKGLISNVVQNSTVPVIETGTGNCHIYVDEYADIDMAVEVIDNAKTQRMGVCNACESLVIHEDIAEEAIPAIFSRLKQKQVEVRGDEKACKIQSGIVPAVEEDWGSEYLDAMISIKTVSSIEEAITHINRYNTGHSESIITKDYDHALKFQNEIDAAAVYVNASTRFTDGYEFGFGAEIGISTQKLHARGPMGLEALTTTKYIIFGNGQIRS